MTRTTFAYDATAALQALSAANQQSPQNEENAPAPSEPAPEEESQ